MSNLTENMDSDKTIIFLHIPKAAGSTLNKIVERQYPPDSIFSIDGFHVQESINKFILLPEDRRRQIKLLKGHMKFGLHQYLPQLSTYITVLRDPIERVISNYYYVRRTPNHFAHNEVTSNNMSLQDYLCSGISTELNNGQTRDLAGVNNTDVSFGNCSSELLETAKTNLNEYFSVVGLTERFDETLILLQKALNWKTPFYIKANVTENRPLRGNIPNDIIEIIEQYNELDIELYGYVKKMFEERINQSAHFSQSQLKQFQFLNGIYSKVYPFSRSLKNRFKLHK